MSGRRAWWMAGAAAGVAFLLGGAGIPALLGVLVEREVEAVMAEDRSAGYTIRDGSIDRGIWRSRVRAIVELGGRAGEWYYQQLGEPLLVTLEAEIRHGPLVRGMGGGWTPGAASAVTTVDPPDAWSGHFQPGVIRSRSGFGSRSEHRATLPARPSGGEGASDAGMPALEGLEWDETVVELRLEPEGWEAALRSDAVAFRSLQALEEAGSETASGGEGTGMEVRLDDLRWFGSGPSADEQDPGGRRAGRVDAGRVALKEPASGRVEITGLQGHWSWTPGTPLPRIAFGLEGGGYRSWLPDAPVGETSSELESWRLDGRLAVTGDRASVSLAGDARARKPDPFDARFEAAVQGLHAPATADLLRAAAGAWGSADPYRLGIAVGERLLVRLPELLEARPGIAVETEMEGVPGTARAAGALRYEGPASVLAHQWREMVGGLAGDAAVRMDPRWLELLLVALLRQELAASAEEPDARTEARLLDIAREQIAMMRDAGWFTVDEDGRLQARIRLEQGRLRFNDEEAAVLPGAESR